MVVNAKNALSIETFLKINFVENLNARKILRLKRMVNADYVLMAK